MKNCLISVFSLLVVFSGCIKQNHIPDSPEKPVTIQKAEKIVYWLDKETGTVHKVETHNGVDSVVSIVKYRKGIPLEEMKIIISDTINNKTHWIYFVPSTNYTVELTILSVLENSVSIEWKNRNEEGYEDSGNEMFIRCDENGTISAGDSPIKSEELPEDFSKFENIK